MPLLKPMTDEHALSIIRLHLLNEIECTERRLSRCTSNSPLFAVFQLEVELRTLNEQLNEVKDKLKGISSNNETSETE